MSTLRARTIRLANENPDLQPVLLPILAEDTPKVAVHTNGKGTTGLGALRGEKPNARLPRPTAMPGYKSPEPPAKKPVKGTAIRSGYYESGDKIYALESAVKADPATSGDAKLIKAVEDLQKAHSAVYAALKPYNWD